MARFIDTRLKRAVLAALDQDEALTPLFLLRDAEQDLGERIPTSTFYAALADLVDHRLVERLGPSLPTGRAAAFAAVEALADRVLGQGRTGQPGHAGRAPVRGKAAPEPPAGATYRLTPTGEALVLLHRTEDSFARRRPAEFQRSVNDLKLRILRHAVA